MFTVSRPKVTSELIREVIEPIAKKFFVNCNTIIKHYRYGMDGYELMTYLCRWEDWDIEPELLEELDDIHWRLYERLKELEAKWVEENNIQPPYPVGTKLKEGTIEEIKYISAEYLVLEYGRVAKTVLNIIKFEDAKLL